LPPTGMQKHAVRVVLIYWANLLASSLRANLHIHYFRSWLYQQVEGGGDEGKADVLDHLRLPRGHRDGALLQVDLDIINVESVFLVLAGQDHEDWLGAWPP